MIEKNKKIAEIIKSFHLQGLEKKYPRQLSGGQLQRVAMARCIIYKPDILMLDEPFSALDYQTRLAVSDDVYKIIKNEKKTVIMVTHDLAEAISLADKVIVLSKRPCRIKKIYDIKLTNKSTPIENRKAKEFADYYEKIWKELDVVI